VTTPPTTLHDTLRAELDRRLAVARAATPGPWRVCAEGSEGSRIAPDYRDALGKSRFIGILNGRVQPEDGRNAAHIALHDPTDAIRRYTGELEVLERHAPRRLVGEMRGWVDVKNPERCARCWADWPCVELMSLASRLGVNVDG